MSADGRARRTAPPHPDRPRDKYRDPLMGKAYVHTIFNDHSRVAYPEIHDDETAITATAVRVRVVEWLNACGELEGWLHYYNHQRPRSAHLAGSRLHR